MSTKLFADMVEDVNPDVPGCPHETVRRAIRQAAIDTCEATLLWRHETRSLTLTPGLHYYEYTKPVGSAVCAVFAAINNGRIMQVLTLEQAIAAYPEWADVLSDVDPVNVWSLTEPSEFNEDEFNAETFNSNPAFVAPEEALTKTGLPMVFTQLNPHKFIVLPSPDNVTPYKLRVFTALKPTPTSDGMDMYAADELYEVIQHRALQKLMVMPDKPWTNFELAAYHTKQYRFTASERRAKANLTNARGRFHVDMRGWT
jgi:hypothetical protein